MLRVVVIDDSLLIQRQLVAVLEEAEGVAVVGVAGDGEEGLRLVRELEPDFVTLDIRLPRMSGLEVLAELKAEPSPRRVAILTSYPELAYRIRCQELGADHFLDKASDVERLPDLIRGVAVA